MARSESKGFTFYRVTQKSDNIRNARVMMMMIIIIIIIIITIN